MNAPKKEETILPEILRSSYGWALALLSARILHFAQSTSDNTLSNALASIGFL